MRKFILLVRAVKLYGFPMETMYIIISNQLLHTIRRGTNYTDCEKIAMRWTDLDTFESRGK